MTTPKPLNRVLLERLIRYAYQSGSIKNIETANPSRRIPRSFEDATIEYAEFEDGTPLTDEELDILQDQQPDLASRTACEDYYLHDPLRA